MTDKELLMEIDKQKAIMVSVSTGGERIQNVNEDYQARRELLRVEFEGRKIFDPNPFDDLWRWYGKWSGGDLPTYQSRREYISDLYKPLIDAIRGPKVNVGTELFVEPTGWVKVDNGLDQIRQQLGMASDEQSYQVVGLHCRETLITLAQLVYDPAEHGVPTDVEKISETDSKRMLDAYLSAKLSGSSNEAARKHAKAALDFASVLVHKRTATFRDAALCAEATSSVVNLIAIISGRRDPMN